MEFLVGQAEKGIICDCKNTTAEKLNDLLRKYYAEVKSKSKNCASLAPNTLTCLYNVIHRHITSAPFSRMLDSHLEMDKL